HTQLKAAPAATTTPRRGHASPSEATKYRLGCKWRQLGSFPSGVILSIAAGMYLARSSETLSAGIPNLLAKSFRLTNPITCWICDGVTGALGPVDTHDLACSPKPFLWKFATTPWRPPSCA